MNLSVKQENSYYGRIDKSLHDEDAVRRILIQALKAVQPPKSRFA